MRMVWTRLRPVRELEPTNDGGANGGIARLLGACFSYLAASDRQLYYPRQPAGCSA